VEGISEKHIKRRLDRFIGSGAKARSSPETGLLITCAEGSVSLRARRATHFPAENLQILRKYLSSALRPPNQRDWRFKRDPGVVLLSYLPVGIRNPCLARRTNLAKSGLLRRG